MITIQQSPIVLTIMTAICAGCSPTPTRPKSPPKPFVATIYPREISPESHNYPGVRFGQSGSVHEQTLHEKAQSMTVDELRVWAESTRREIAINYNTLTLLDGFGKDNPYKPEGEKWGWGVLREEIRRLQVSSNTLRATLDSSLDSRSSKSTFIHTYAYVGLWSEELLNRTRQLVRRILEEGYNLPDAIRDLDRFKL